MASYRKLYTVIVAFLSALLKLISPAFPKVRLFFSVRKNLFADLEKKTGSLPDNRPRIWVHASSAGEFEQSRPVLAEVRKACPDALVFLSFFSDSGYNLYRNCSDATIVFYHPVDSPRNARKTVSLIGPDVVMVMRYDFWPNHLHAAKKQGAALILAAAVLRQKNRYSKPLIRELYRSVFSLFDLIFTVSDNDRKRFAETFGIQNAITAGDPRFDQVKARSVDTGKIDRLAGFYKNRTVLIGGSTWEKDENLLLPAYLSLSDALEMILAPHDVSTSNIVRLEKELDSAGIASARLSALSDNFSAKRVLIIDHIGLLAELYSIASIAYVGGGFGINVHNTLEPAVYGIPVLFGPRHHNSPEAIELASIGGATVVDDNASLLETLRNLVDHPEAQQEQGRIAGRYVQSRLGASAKIARTILKPLSGLNG